MDVASAAAEVKLWKLSESEKPQATFSSHESKINCIRWNHNNQVLVSCSDDGGVILSHQSGRMLGRLPTGPNEPPLHSLAFSSGSRYLCSGGAATVVDVWDLKHKKKTRTFTGHDGTISSMVFAKGDTKVASGSHTGDVLVHSVVTGTTMCKLDCGQEAIRDIQYSPHRPSVLATGGDDSCICLWDTNSSALLHKFSREHHAPIKQVVFSPSTQSLLCSAGLDKKVIFYDVAKMRTVKQIVTEFPLTSLGFHGDGVHFVLGTMQGHLLAYDFRKSDMPTHTINNAHSSAINCVQFQHVNVSARKNSYVAPPSPAPSTDLFSPIKTALTPVQQAASPSYSVLDEKPGNDGAGFQRSMAGRDTSFSTPEAATPLSHQFESAVALNRTPLHQVHSSMEVPQTSSETQQVQLNLIKKVVNEAVGSVRASLKEDINNLHLELLRQFHVQQMELRGMLENFTNKQADLVKEVQDLRVNYEDLKHVY